MTYHSFYYKYKINLIRKLKVHNGFTLIELLVVVVIIGILGALALPSYISQAGKARGSEAKSSLGSINRAQQAYRLERGTFAPDIATLNPKVNNKFYTFSVSGAPTATFATHTAAAQQNDLKGYSSAVMQNGGVFSHLTCETETVVAINDAATPPIMADVQNNTCQGTDVVVD